MMSEVRQNPAGWRSSKDGFALLWFGSLLACWFLLRVAILVAFHPPSTSAGDILLTFLSGLHRDAFAALAETLPVLVWFLFARPKREGRPRRHIGFWLCCLLFWFVQVFLLLAEYFFFEEFKSRFNTVAVDYLIYPREVFINIWESYSVVLVVLVCLALSGAWVFAAGRMYRGMFDQPRSRAWRWGRLGAALGLLAVCIPTFDLKGAHVTNDRTLNEIANNGALSFWAAAWTHDLDFAAYYKTLPAEEAHQRVRRLLAAPNAQFVPDPDSIKRHISGDTSRPRLNVVLFLEESLGSEFWGCLGRPDTLTPEMDRLATTEGILFTNLYACGNRTVRGMEGVLSSFPPLPGDSIVKRDRSDNVETVARILKRDGYSTIFLYGGRGLFDGMRSYAVRNGYDRFVEQKHFAHPTFTTIWGVCDEDLYARTIEECRTLSQTNRPFFATVLSVSNHKPYTYPKGRIAEDPDRHKREYAVKYSDFALGEFFRAAKKEAFWTNTIFAVVADHGARVYGSQAIPIHSYEIPLVLLGPAIVQHPSVVRQLGSSLDVSPTILGLIGRPYDTLFFGRDLLLEPPSPGRALLNHNRDIGMLSGDRLVVLGLLKEDEFYGGDPKKVNMMPLNHPSAGDLELEKDAISLFQTADELYTTRRYHLDP